MWASLQALPRAERDCDGVLDCRRQTASLDLILSLKAAGMPYTAFWLESFGTP